MSEDEQQDNATGREAYITRTLRKTIDDEPKHAMTKVPSKLNYHSINIDDINEILL